MKFRAVPVHLTPEQFELFVCRLLRTSSHFLEFLKVEHSVRVQGYGGEFEIDVLASFRVLGADFRVLVECKHHKSAIKRDLVQILADKVRLLRAHKGLLFATSNFQVGAIEYAEKHGIALVKITKSGQDWIRRNKQQPFDEYEENDLIGIHVHQGDSDLPSIIHDGLSDSIDLLIFKSPANQEIT